MRNHFIVILFLTAVALSAAENTLLIMKENTGYKKALIKELVAEFDNGSTEITIVDHRKEDISKINPSDYDAVFITNSGAQAKVRPNVLAWLEANGHQDENIILHTTQINDWTPPVKVDSITSASTKKNIDALVEDISVRIRKFF